MVFGRNKGKRQKKILQRLAFNKLVVLEKEKIRKQQLRTAVKRAATRQTRQRKAAKKAGKKVFKGILRSARRIGSERAAPRRKRKVRPITFF